MSDDKASSVVSIILTDTTKTDSNESLTSSKNDKYICFCINHKWCFKGEDSCINKFDNHCLCCKCLDCCCIWCFEF